MERGEAFTKLKEAAASKGVSVRRAFLDADESLISKLRSAEFKRDNLLYDCLVETDRDYQEYRRELMALPYPEFIKHLKQPFNARLFTWSGQTLQDFEKEYWQKAKATELLEHMRPIILSNVKALALAGDLVLKLDIAPPRWLIEIWVYRGKSTSSRVRSNQSVFEKQITAYLVNVLIRHYKTTGYHDDLTATFINRLNPSTASINTQTIKKQIASGKKILNKMFDCDRVSCSSDEHITLAIALCGLLNIDTAAVIAFAKAGRSD